MKLLTLFAALVLPWANGYIWLSYFESFFGVAVKKNHFRVLGYGFFFGYAALSFVILLLSSISGKVSFFAVMSVLSVLTGTGLFLTMLRGRSAKNGNGPSIQASPGSRFHWAESALMALLIIWIAVHLLFSIVEMLSIPVFPWDAWKVWVYRAKAWFYMGDVLQLFSLDDWLNHSSSLVYTMSAWEYPLFASVIPFWAATSLGYWSETLVNAPVMFCAMAIGMALYGQCREYGTGALPALLVCYLLFSTPLLGTHISLAGYADIWMVGFTGLGFVAVLRGSISSCSREVLIGLAMLLMGAAVKNEGVVWFATALLFLLVVHIPWKLLLSGLAVAAALVLLAMAFGVTSIDLPLLGEVGIAGKKIMLPFVGSFDMVVYKLWHEFYMSFFALGSWNLTWTLVLASLLLALMTPTERVNYQVSAFILIVISTQVFIFSFTNHGQWAVTYTAINRLPLHFLPALLFSMAAVTQNRFRKLSGPEPGRGERRELVTG